ncbi:hypothetical protein MNBD_IGNAVI01-799 [hydrothermal vent metagenome]|uniref:Uncharacterized protein n=1 Tax=hydrothermal vent metagenome TaxID=652676 RepID=A0A3B1CEC6_9ZZZZ
MTQILDNRFEILEKESFQKKQHVPQLWEGYKR